MSGAGKLLVQSVATGHAGDSGKLEGLRPKMGPKCPFMREVRVTEQS